MITKLLLIFSFLLNSIGFNGLSESIDRNIIDQKYGSTQKAIAQETQLPLPPIKIPPKVSENVIYPNNIYAKRYILMDTETGIVFTGQNQSEKVPIASTTKIMTAIIALENYQLDEVVTVSQKAASQIGSDANLRVGEQISVLNLLKLLLLKSANDVAYALAEHMDPSKQSPDIFIAKMNQKALALGMKDTDYRDPAGLDVTGYSTAYDLTIATRYALRKPVFAEIVKTKEIMVADITGNVRHAATNSNRLVAEWNYPGAIGVKTGYMPEAGHCLVAAVERDGHTLISVILYTLADTPQASAEESRKLQNWGWQNIIW